MNNVICTNCNIMKHKSGFYIKDKKSERLSKWCKQCTLSFQKKRWKDRKAKVVELMGKKCEQCGYDKNYAALDLHHIDPKKKSYLFKDLVKKPWNIVIVEIQKCQLLCRNCHMDHHYPEWRKNIVDTPTKHAKHLERDRPIYKHSSKCPACKGPAYGTKYCSIECARLSRRKVKARPSKEQLIQMMSYMSLCAIGRKFGVSDNAVRKWLNAPERN